mgnify:CR=1 FL=1
MGISMPQLIIILVVVALIFGTKKLRNIGSDLGGAVKGFKKGMADEEAAKELPEDSAQQQEQSQANKEDSK